MTDAWARLVFSLKKRYSLPIISLLLFKKELTFDQIYDLCSRYAGLATERRPAAIRRRILIARERGPTYRAISRKSISDSLAELKTKEYITKAARLNKVGRSYAVYVLTDEARHLLESYLKR